MPSQSSNILQRKLHSMRETPQEIQSNRHRLNQLKSKERRDKLPLAQRNTKGTTIGMKGTRTG